MGTASLHPKAWTIALMAFTWAESFCVARKKYELLMEVREGLVAEKDIIGTWAFSPRSITKLACIDVFGPKIACTSTFFIKSRAAFQKESRKINDFCSRERSSKESQFLIGWSFCSHILWPVSSSLLIAPHLMLDLVSVPIQKGLMLKIKCFGIIL